MEEKKLWKSAQKDKYLYFTNLEDYFKYLDDNNLNLRFITKDSFTPGDIVETRLDNIALRNNLKIVYTDNSHPIAMSQHNFYTSMISKSFYENNKEAFKTYALKKFHEALKNNNIHFISIPDFIFDDELLKEIINNKNNDHIKYQYFECTNHSEITDKEKQIIGDNFLEFEANYRGKENEQISSRYLISYYTKSDLKNIASLDLYIPLKENEIDNLIYVNENAQVSFFINPNDKQNEEYYLNYIQNIFRKIANHNHNYNIQIMIKNRQILNNSKLLDNIPKNVNLSILNDLYEYDIETYQKEEVKIERIIAPIRDSNMSPLEKYLAVYNIVKKFKPYKENEEKPEMARDIRYIIDNNNEYMVCAGFSNLLTELLNRIGIPNKDIGVSVDISYDEGYTIEEKNISVEAHARNLIKIDDDKYHIHGYYLADSTWDNYIEHDIYLNALMTFDRKKEAKRLERLGNVDLLLDFHNLEEFKAKITHILNHEINSILYNEQYQTLEMKDINNIKKKYQDLLDKSQDKLEKQRLTNKMNIEINEIIKDVHKQAYKILEKMIMGILQDTDKEKYYYFFDQYDAKINDYSASLKEIEQAINDMLYEYAKYILPLSNNRIKFSDILIAAARSKRLIEGYSKEELKEWLSTTFKENQAFERELFPYRYDPNNKTEAYLTDAYNKNSNSITK